MCEMNKKKNEDEAIVVGTDFYVRILYCECML